MKIKTSDTLNVARRKAIILSGSAAAAGLSLGAAFYLFQNKKEKVETKIDQPGDASGPNFGDYVLAPRYLGNPSAPIQIIEFFSMTCSHCASFHRNTFPMVKQRLIDENIVRFEKRAFPLDGLALRAHAMARSLPLNKYYPMIDMLMEKQPIWTNAEDPIKALKKLANRAGLSGAEFDAVMLNKPLLESIVEMRQEALRRWEVQATPSFVINSKTVISGSLSYDEFAEKINATGT